LSKSAKPLPELSEEQKQFIRDNWKMDRRELVQKTFNDSSLTLRNIEAKAVIAYLAELGLGGKVPAALSTDVELTDEQRQYIDNNHDASNPLEMARTIFGDRKLSLYSPEGKAVLAYLRKIAPDLYRSDDEQVEERDYAPPRNLREMISRVNRLVPNPNGLTEPLYDANKLNSQQEKNLNTLLACCNIPRFIHQASQYLRKVDRELFESTFLGQLHDKTDLSREDIEQYITYCSSIVSTAQLERTIQRIQTQADDAFEGDQKVSMSLVEHLKALNSNLQDEKKRQEQLYKVLNGARSTRMQDLTNASLSMHPLVQMWRTKEGRARLLASAKRKNDALAAEVTRLSEMDALRADIWGISTTTILR
jgi:hypothetical protein